MHKLLLADDSVTIQRVIELTFSGEDVQVVAVNDGEQAMARIPIERPDVVLADIGMPRKGGYDVAAFVKSRPDLAHIPVLLLAGAFEPVDQARAEQVKADGVLIKPFEPRQVIERVKELLAGHPAIERFHAESPEPAAAPARPHVSHPPAAPDPQPNASDVFAEGRTLASGGQSLDDLFESLNQALSSAAQPGPSAASGRDALPRPAGDLRNGSPRSTDADTAPLRFEPLPTAAGPSSSLDDYFHRLTSAFAKVAPAPPQSDVADAPATLRPLADEASNDGAVAPKPFEWIELTQSVDGGNGHGETNPILAAIATLTTTGALEAGAPVADQPIVERRPSTPFPSASVDGQAAQAMVDEVATRVLARLAPAVAESLRQLTEQELERLRRADR